MNVTLRDLQTSDGAWLDAWLPPVASRVGYTDAGVAAFLPRMTKEPKFRARIIVRDDNAVGFTVYRTISRHAAMTELIATPPEHARKGVGMGAAVAIEQGLRTAGVTTIFAPAPAANGIAMYFWIRLGYAPILRADWPCEREGVAWLRRVIARDD